MNVVLVTIPEGQGEPLARKLIGQAVCSCVNVIPGGSSFYIKEGELATASEELMIIKVAQADVGILHTALKEHHPYDTPEFVALTVDTKHSDDDYVSWVRYATR